MIAGYLSFIADHLWQSTLFAAVVYLLTLILKENRAAVRYRLWVAASIKFLLPFAVLIALGGRAEWAADKVAPPAALVSAVQGLSQPFAVSQPISPQTAPQVPRNPEPVPASAVGNPETGANRLPIMVFAVWLCGAAFIFLPCLRECWRV